MYNAKIRAWKQKEKLVVGRLVHLDVEDCSEELLRQQSYATYVKGFQFYPSNYPDDIKNQRAFERKIPLVGGLWMPELVLYGIRLSAQALLGKLSTNERQASKFLDQ